MPIDHNVRSPAHIVSNTGVLTQHDVGEDLVIRHLDMTNSDTQAKDLLELELDGGTDLSDLVVQVLSVRDWGRELASCGMNE